MIKKPCGHRGCNVLVPVGTIYCPKHEEEHIKQFKEWKKRKYKKYQEYRLKDETEKKYQYFYCSESWKKLSKNIKKHYMGMCVLCWVQGRIIDADTTHHIVTLRDDYNKRLEHDNLIPLCNKCHSKVHRVYSLSDNEKRKMQSIEQHAIKDFERKLIKEK